MSVDSNRNDKPHVEVGIVDWFYTIPFLITFVSILVIFDPIQRLALLLGRRAHEHIIVVLNRCLVLSLKLCGSRIKVSGLENIPAEGPILIISNHQSLFDIPIIHTFFARHFPRFVAKMELGRWLPSVSYNLKYGGNAIIDRSNPRQAVKELQSFSERLKQMKFAAVIFPEGTRAKDGQLKPFRTAGLSTLLKNVPEAKVVPVAIDGAWKLAAKRLLPVPRGMTVTVAIGEAVSRGQDGFTEEILIEKAYEFVSKAIANARAEQ